jgi:hypothetical protein
VKGRRIVLPIIFATHQVREQINFGIADGQVTQLHGLLRLRCRRAGARHR